MKSIDASRKKKIVWAVVPARKGSKRLPGKNVRLLCGKPMISHTLKAALQCRDLDRVIVSTNDPDVVRTAEKMGVQVPFHRPAALCGDQAASLPVVRHAVEWWEKETGEQPDAVMLLQPTSPLRTSDDIKQALKKFFHGDFDSLESFTPAHEPAAYQYRLRKSGEAIPILPGLVNKASSEMEPFYIENGAIYIVRRDVLFKRGLYGNKHGAFVMPRERSVDVDTEMDFLLAELLMRGKK